MLFYLSSLDALFYCNVFDPAIITLISPSDFELQQMAVCVCLSASVRPQQLQYGRVTNLQVALLSCLEVFEVILCTMAWYRLIGL